MKKLSPLAKKILIGIALLFAIILFSIPWIVEYYLEKNDVEWLGREVEVADIDINLFTGKVGVYNAFLFEEDGTTPFLRFESFEANIRMLSFLSGIFELEYVTVSNSLLRIVQTGESFNFDDLAKPGESESTGEDDEAGDPPRYIINEILLTGGAFEYIDNNLSSSILIDRIRLEIPRVSYDYPGLDFILAGTQREGGELGFDGSVNWGESNFAMNGEIADWQLRPYKNYLNSYLAIQDFAGLYNLQLNIAGKYADEKSIAASAYSTLDKFLLVDNNSDSLITWKRAEIFVDSVNTEERLYDMGTATLDAPHILFKYFKEGDSFSGLLLDTTSAQVLDTVSVAQQEIVFQNPFQYISEYIYYLIDEEVLTTYGADSMVIHKGRVDFLDYSHLEDAQITLENLNILIPEVSPEDSTLSMLINSRINKTGKFKGDMTLYRAGLSNMGINMELSDFYLTSFDPYSRHYTAHPMWEGVMNMKSSTTIRDYQVQSMNEIDILDVKVGNKLDIESEYKIPLRFAVGLLKDVNGDIRLEVPIEGDLHDPEYKLGKVILKVIMNLFAKAVASPYNLLARAFDADEDDLKSIKFGNDQDSLANPQIKTMDLTARVLERKSDLKVLLEYVFNEKEEKEIIALQYAKEKYLQQAPDSIRGLGRDQVSNRDSLFVLYLEDKVGGLGQRSVQAMCIELIGESMLDERVAYIRESQWNLVSEYLYQEKGVSPERAEMKETEDEGLMSVYLQPTFLIKYDVRDSIPDGVLEENRPAESTVPGDSVVVNPTGN
ncbi:DUF748 domain-containing protein [Fulvivirga sedimenti]|uniref:DUF748 domain-containing protein n=1 Tax=Fulvivirga sedimenti TaxID=2879465 RepID=A0A9X1KZ20_9BACT|nr:DUF748 domain-containing protein [Fulvivirga sedimenti]MCA6075432.1 DUF748 domain-containing protein [Fulvivirga sedimenti]MCA6076609.1 DUF748 domain-containing protein [Fulvivirga sedimenti]MCA6077737.1 DUF748 domain-containing protein [Fulvivirga sedimenti]